MNGSKKVKVGGSKLDSHPDHLQRWANGENPGPLVIEVGLAHGCNQNCVHCGYQQYSPYAKRKTFLEADVFLQFLDDFHALGGEEVFFAGHGEPTLHPNLPDFLQHGHQLGLSMALSSNGITFTEKNCAAIVGHTSWIRFSVNGGNRETYARVHNCKERDFDQLVRNLAFATRYSRENDHPGVLALQFVVFDLNWPSIPDMVALHKQVGTDQLIFRSKVDKEGRGRATPEIVELLKMAEQEDKVFVRWESFEDKECTPRWSQCYCIHFRTNMNDQGELFACQRDFHCNSSFGNIRQHRFVDLWNSANKRELFSTIEKGHDIPHCGKWCQSPRDNLLAENFLSQRG